MRKLFLLGLFALACVGAALAMPALAEADDALLFMDDTGATYSISQASLSVCPVGTRGLTIPRKHVPFWKQYRLTRKLSWANRNRYLCVPHRLRASLNPVIAKLRTERAIQHDPLTMPVLMREIDTLDIVEPMAEEESAAPLTEEEQQQRALDAALFDEADDTDAMSVQQMGDFDSLQRGGFRRGGGWGGRGWGGRGWGRGWGGGWGRGWGGGWGGGWGRGWGGGWGGGWGYPWGGGWGGGWGRGWGGRWGGWGRGRRF